MVKEETDQPTEKISTPAMTPETYKIKEKEKNNARALKRKAFMEKLNE